jgi:hypothetical protein
MNLNISFHHQIENQVSILVNVFEVNEINITENIESFEIVNGFMNDCL